MVNHQEEGLRKQENHWEKHQENRPENRKQVKRKVKIKKDSINSTKAKTFKNPRIRNNVNELVHRK